jgi:hypothetical protein
MSHHKKYKNKTYSDVIRHQRIKNNIIGQRDNLVYSSFKSIFIIFDIFEEVLKYLNDDHGRLNIYPQISLFETNA